MPGRTCLTEANAQQVAENIAIVTGGKGIFNRTIAEAAIAVGFSDSSQSIASIIDGGGTKPIPLNKPSYTGKQAFIDANAAQTSQTVYKELNLYHTCDVVIQRFEVTNLTPERPRGIQILECVPAPAGNLFPWQIKQVYTEVNSAAWLVDLGVFNATS